MEVYIHAFLVLAMTASVVSSTPRRGLRAGVDSVETRKLSVPAGNRVRIPCGVVTTVTELPQSVTGIGGTAAFFVFGSASVRTSAPRPDTLTYFS